MSNGLPHTTYRLPLGTPWRVLVLGYIGISQLPRDPMDDGVLPGRPTSEALTDAGTYWDTALDQLIGHFFSTKELKV